MTAPTPAAHAPLPDLLNPSNNTSTTCIRGPTRRTNWAVGNQLVMHGPMPIAGQASYTALVPYRFTHFVSLVEDTDAPTKNYLGAYRADTNDHDGVEAISIPLLDGAPLTEKDYTVFMAAVHRIADVVRMGAAAVLAEGSASATSLPNSPPPPRVYVHCLKGHGRSGMFIAALLAVLYNVAPLKALNLTNRLHECREEDDGYCSPENHEQRLSVMTMLMKVGVA